MALILDGAEIVDEEELKAQIRCLGEQNEQLRCDRDKLESLLEDKANVIRELQGKIEFFKGQIEAYQYCMNCRR